MMDIDTLIETARDLIERFQQDAVAQYSHTRPLAAAIVAEAELALHFVELTYFNDETHARYAPQAESALRRAQAIVQEAAQ